MVSVGTAASEARVGAGCGPAEEEASDAFRSDDRREVFFSAVDGLDFFLAMGSLTNQVAARRVETPYASSHSLRQQRLYLKMDDKSCSFYSGDSNARNCFEQAWKGKIVSLRMSRSIETDTPLDAAARLVTSPDWRVTHPRSDAADTDHRPGRRADRLHSNSTPPHSAGHWPAGRYSVRTRG